LATINGGEGAGSGLTVSAVFSAAIDGDEGVDEGLGTALGSDETSGGAGEGAAFSKTSSFSDTIDGDEGVDEGFGAALGSDETSGGAGEGAAFSKTSGTQPITVKNSRKKNPAVTIFIERARPFEVIRRRTICLGFFMFCLPYIDV
jgi:hypothetical protein